MIPLFVSRRVNYGLKWLTSATMHASKLERGTL